MLELIHVLYERVLPDGDGETVTFGLDGTEYEIDLSTDITVARLAACTRFVTVDPVAAAVARSVGVRTVRLDAADDLTALFTALQTGADLDRPDDRRARDLAFALDAWQRGRSSTAALWSSVRRVDSTDDLVVA